MGYYILPIDAEQEPYSNKCHMEDNYFGRGCNQYILNPTNKEENKRITTECSLVSYTEQLFAVGGLPPLQGMQLAYSKLYQQGSN